MFSHGKALQAAEIMVTFTQSLPVLCSWIAPTACKGQGSEGGVDGGFRVTAGEGAFLLVYICV